MPKLGNVFQIAMHSTTNTITLEYIQTTVATKLAGLSRGYYQPFLRGQVHGSDDCTTTNSSLGLSDMQQQQFARQQRNKRQPVMTQSNNHINNADDAATALLSIACVAYAFRRRGTATRRAIERKRVVVCALLALALLLLVRVVSATTTVTSFSALSAANVDGADIDVVTDVTFTSQLTITGTVAITSTTGATVSGGGSTRFFYLNGGTLTLSSLTLDDGAVSTDWTGDYTTCMGGALYIAASSSATLIAVAVTGAVARHGGGVLVFGTLEATGSTFSGNSAVDMMMTMTTTMMTPPRHCVCTDGRWVKSRVSSEPNMALRYSTTHSSPPLGARLRGCCDTRHGGGGARERARRCHTQRRVLAA